MGKEFQLQGKPQARDLLGGCCNKAERERGRGWLLVEDESDLVEKSLRSKINRMCWFTEYGKKGAKRS